MVWRESLFRERKALECCLLLTNARVDGKVEPFWNKNNGIDSECCFHLLSSSVLLREKNGIWSFKCVFFLIYILISAHLHVHCTWWCESCGRCNELCSFIFSSFFYFHTYSLVEFSFHRYFAQIWICCERCSNSFNAFVFDVRVLLSLLQWLCIWFNWHFTLINKTFAFLVQIRFRPIFPSSSSTSIFIISHSSKIERLSVNFSLALRLNH